MQVVIATSARPCTLRKGYQSAESVTDLPFKAVAQTLLPPIGTTCSLRAGLDFLAVASHSAAIV